MKSGATLLTAFRCGMEYGRLEQNVVIRTTQELGGPLSLRRVLSDLGAGPGFEKLRTGLPRL